MKFSYLILPFVTAAIGWVTNVIAVKMLFHPKKPLRLGFCTLQGVIPKRRDALAESISTLFDKELLSVMELAGQFLDIDVEDELSSLLDKHLDAYIERVKKAIPMAAMFLTGETAATLKREAKEELLKMIPELKERIAGKMHSHYDLQAFVKEKIQSFSLEKLEGMVMHVATKELKTIERLGGLLGFLIGVVQLGLMVYCC